MNSILQVEVPPEKVDSARLSALYGSMGSGDVVYDHYALQLLIGVATGQHPSKDVAAQKTAIALLNAGLTAVIASF